MSIPRVAVCISVPGAVLLNLSLSRWTVMLTSFTIAFPSILACRVFRRFKLQAIAYEAANMPTLSALPVTESVVLVPHVEVEDACAGSSA